MNKSLLELLKEEQFFVDKVREVENNIRSAIEANDEFGVSAGYVGRKEAEDGLDRVRREILTYHHELCTRKMSYDPCLI